MFCVLFEAGFRDQPATVGKLYWCCPAGVAVRRNEPFPADLK